MPDASQDIATLEKTQAALFCREVLLAEPATAAVYIGLLVGNLDEDEMRQDVIRLLNASGYLTTPEAVAEALQAMRKSDVSIWRGAYEMFIDGKRGPRLAITGAGEVFLADRRIQQPHYADDRLQWSAADGNPGDGDVRFALPAASDALPTEAPSYARYSGPVCTGIVAVKAPAGSRGVSVAVGKARGKISVYSLTANEVDDGIDAIATWAGSYLIETDAWSDTNVRLDVNGVTEVVLLGGQQIYPPIGSATASWSQGNNLTWTGGFRGSSGNITFSQTQGTRELLTGRIWIPPAAAPTVIRTAGYADPSYPFLQLSDWVGTYACSAGPANSLYMPPDTLVVGINSAGQPTASLGGQALANVTYNQTSAILAWQGTTDPASPKYRTVYGSVQFSFDATRQPPKRFSGTMWDFSAHSQAPGDENFNGELPASPADSGSSSSSFGTADAIALAGGVVTAIGVYVAYLQLRKESDGARDAARQAPGNVELARRAADAGQRQAAAADNAAVVADAAVANIDRAAAAAGQPIGVDGSAGQWAQRSAANVAEASLAAAELQADRARQTLADARALADQIVQRREALEKQRSESESEVDRARMQDAIAAIDAEIARQEAVRDRAQREASDLSERSESRDGNAAEHADDARVPGAVDG